MRRGERNSNVSGTLRVPLNHGTRSVPDTFGKRICLVKSLNSSTRRRVLSAAGWLLAALLAGGCLPRTDISWHLPGADEARDKDPPGGKKTAPPDEAETLRELAKRVDAADDPRFTAAARSHSPAVRIETLRAWATGRRGTLPAAIVELRSDDDPRVRAEALATLAARKHPEALDSLTAALHDVDLDVRLAAVRGLGKLDSDPSRAALGKLIKDRAELVRAEAVAATAVHGPEAAVLAAASDPCWRVRLKAAEALAGYRDAEAASAARRMLEDPSAEVQRQVVRSLAAWPLEAAVPVLLDALGRDAVSVRKLAAEQLAARWTGYPLAGREQFPYEAAPARRTQALAELRSRCQQEIVERGAWSVGHEATTLHASRSTLHAPSEERVEQLLNAGDFAALANFGPEIVAVLERLTTERRLTLPEAVYHEVLPGCSPVFAALDRQRHGQAAARQQAAEELAALARKQPLGEMAVGRLCALMTGETDAAVWLSALDAIDSDAREPAVRMARLALGRNAGEVRRRACAFLAAHPDPAHEAFLLPLLADGEQGVVLAAVRALGAAGRMTDVGAIKRLLASDDANIQLETGVALVRFHDPAGEDALRRLGYSNDVKIRCRLALALGDLGDARFTPVLIRLLDDSKATVSHAALASLPRVVGRDAAQSDDGTTVSTNEQIARWKKWHEAR
jgi:HEAT repeat protein